MPSVGDRQSKYTLLLWGQIQVKMLNYSCPWNESHFLNILYIKHLDTVSNQARWVAVSAMVFNWFLPKGSVGDIRVIFPYTYHVKINCQLLPQQLRFFYEQTFILNHALAVMFPPSMKQIHPKSEAPAPSQPPSKMPTWLLYSKIEKLKLCVDSTIVFMKWISVLLNCNANYTVVVLVFLGRTQIRPCFLGRTMMRPFFAWLNRDSTIFSWSYPDSTIFSWSNQDSTFFSLSF